MGWRIKKQTEEEPQEEQYTKEIPSEEKYKPSMSTSIERIEVVKELPFEYIRKYKDRNGNIVNLVTIEEALTEILNEK
jgi:hypothetical protein